MRFSMVAGCTLALTLASVLTACNPSSKENSDGEGIATALPTDHNEVTVHVLERQLFSHELVSNGKVTATHVADLRFVTAEMVTHIYVKNGDRVRRGDRLAELDKFKLHNRTTQAADALEKARLDLQDILIGQGYAAGDTANVPKEMMQLARIKSGYDQSQATYQLARYEEQQATLTAPFDGVVANLTAKTYNVANTSEPFCTLIGTQGMEVNFTVLENELSLIKNGDKVVIAPYADPNTTYEGEVAQINPFVDDKGMVQVKASIPAVAQTRLFNGMNVRVHVYRTMQNELVIPKSAVVLRSGRQVVFTLNKGRAWWNYITTGQENGDSYTVNERGEGTEGLNVGDSVIVTGNVNLAHEAPVSVIKNRE
ncbi:MAG: efflux RND transporter periplasmic adaptor subunit [Mediterranea sp.]|nr:efflux RND transporter periplasmic adaptor subunit [Mediterranea sp.]